MRALAPEGGVSTNASTAVEERRLQRRVRVHITQPGFSPRGRLPREELKPIVILRKRSRSRSGRLRNEGPMHFGSRHQIVQQPQLIAHQRPSTKLNRVVATSEAFGWRNASSVAIAPQKDREKQTGKGTRRSSRAAQGRIKIRALAPAVGFLARPSLKPTHSEEMESEAGSASTQPEP
jgi:hypothetical protein